MTGGKKRAIHCLWSAKQNGTDRVPANGQFILMQQYPGRRGTADEDLEVAAVNGGESDDVDGSFLYADHAPQRRKLQANCIDIIVRSSETAEFSVHYFLAFFLL